MSQTQNPTSKQGLDTPGSAGLKAERVQEGLLPAGRLKAERIQIALKDLPNWRLQRGATQIARTYELADTQQVARLLQYVVELAYAGGLMPELTVKAGQVTFAVPTIASSWLDASFFELAKALEMKA